MQTEYKTLSQKTQLLIKKSEGYDVDFKMNVKGLESEDLVAFANSEGGGTILLGVDEIETGNGQRGKICGCDISDKSKLSIINKAEYCAPPIEIKVFTENLSAKPIFRIEIPSSNQKPHCTQKGIYKIRGDGRNVPLLPNRLLQLFLAQEGETFLLKFKNATEELSNDLLILGARIQTLSHNINSVRGNSEEASETFQEGLSSTGYLPVELQTFQDRINRENEVSIFKMEARIKAILAHLQLEDPLELPIAEVLEQLRNRQNTSELSQK